MNNADRRTLSFVRAKVTCEQQESVDREAVTPNSPQYQAVPSEATVYANQTSYLPAES